jgi:4-hydroxy-3-polyprenylbenzoate decarboxylase
MRPSAQIAAPPRGYPDLHDHLAALEQRGLLIRIREPINKDTEMHPLVRWQFVGGIPEERRKAFLFEHVVDAKGRRYSIPVVVGALATNREIYSLGMGCRVDEIITVWTRALTHPVPPKAVDRAPCHDIIIEGAALDREGQGLDGLPVPISTPGWDNAPYTTTSHFITADPDTGVQNMGIYRGQIKARRRLGMNPSRETRPGIYTHWEKCRARKQKLPCAVVIGAPPVVTFTAVQKLPEAVDELAVAGGLVGNAINVVHAKTVDLMVPAEAEIVIEGYIETEYLEKEGPFGESHGHVNLQEYNAYMEVSAITRRRDAILTSIISQVTPSESSLIKRVAYEIMFLRHLRDQVGIRGIGRVFMHEPLTNIRKVVVLQFARGVPETEIWRALYAAASFQRSVGKFVIAVDEDIDPQNTDAILWALAYRMHPRLDMQVLPHTEPGHGPRSRRGGGQDAAVLMNATLKGAFPPISLPKREFMEHAKELWERLGLPALSPAAPWFGYSLGAWNEELESEAALAVRGDYWETGEAIARQRRKDVEMNTEVNWRSPEE